MECIEHNQKGPYGSSHGKKLHRIVFEKHHGYLPEVVMHTCDNPRCINIEHLQAGTWDDNNKDRARKGRSSKVRHDLRKLSDEDANEIRRRLSLRTTRKDPINGPKTLAEEFGVDVSTIYQVQYRKSHFAIT